MGNNKNNEIHLKELYKFQQETETNFDKITNAFTQLNKTLKTTNYQLERITQELEQSILQRQELSKSLKDIQEEFCRFMDSMCYSLEDRAIKSLPMVLERKYGIVITSPLLRKFVKYSGQEYEVNIYGTGYIESKELFIVGEAKPQLTKDSIDRFLEVIQYIEKFNRTAEERFIFIITCSASPEVEQYAKNKEIEIIWSYEV
jgi:hypothetical protein